MPWTPASKPHIDHLFYLDHLLGNPAVKEYAIGNETPGFVEHWNLYFERLYIVASLMYLEDVFGEDSHWRKTSVATTHPDLYRAMESLRCVRNCIVHNAGRINNKRSKDAAIIRDYDKDVRAGLITDEVRNRAENPAEPILFKPYFSIKTNDILVTSSSSWKVRWQVICYLRAEGVVETTPKP